MRCHERSRARTYRAQAVELLLVHDPLQLTPEVERLGLHGKDRRALRSEGRGSLLIIGDGIEAREAGVPGATHDDGADGDLHRVQLPLQVARSATPEEDQKRAHTCEASSLPRYARSSSRTSNT